MPPAFVAGGFRCKPEGKEDEIGAYLADGIAARDQEAGFTRTYLVYDEKDNLVAFYSLQADAIRLQVDEAGPTWTYPSAPCLKLVRFGVSIHESGNGLGTALLAQIKEFAIELGNQIGVRFLTLDAVADRLDWYRKRGFDFTQIAAQPSSEADKAAGDRSMRWDLGRLSERLTAAEP